MKVLRIFILITLSACGQTLETNPDSQEETNIEFSKSTIPKEKTTYPEWLEKELGFAKNEILSFKNINLATSYCIFQSSTTTCEDQTLVIFYERKEVNRIALGRYCEEDFSKGIRSWKEYKSLPSNSFEITEYIETVKPVSKMQASTEIEKEIDYSDEEPSLEIIKKTILINYNGEIVEIRDK